MKTHVLTFSRRFPVGHPKAGLPTFFVTNIKGGRSKIHTLRNNYDHWVPKIQEVAAGDAILSLRYWSGTPYKSPQKEFHQLTAADGVGIERVQDYTVHAQISAPNRPNYRQMVYLDELAENDGLSRKDFCDWFPHWGQENCRALIHFTPFRYQAIMGILSEIPDRLWLRHRHSWSPQIHLPITDLVILQPMDYGTYIKTADGREYEVRETLEDIEAAVKVQRQKVAKSW